MPAKLPSPTSSPSSTASVSTVRYRQLYLGLGMTTLANLVLELSLTRIFSVVFYYHFAFLAISVALFGLGVGGVLSYVIAPDGGIYKKLGIVSLVNAVLALCAVLFVLT